MIEESIMIFKVKYIDWVYVDIIKKKEIQEISSKVIKLSIIMF